MLKNWQIILFCSVIAIGCSKKAAQVQPATPIITSTAFVPHIDTFQGLGVTKIGSCGPYTNDSIAVISIFVNHPSIDSVFISGKIVSTEYYNDNIPASATFGTYPMNFKFASDSSNVYTSHPYDSWRDTFWLTSDSLHFRMYSSPGSCLFNQLQSFDGKKLP